MGFFQGLGDFVGRGLGIGTPAGSSAYKHSGEDWKKEASKWVDAWGGTNDFSDSETGAPTETGKRFNELSGLYTGEVDRGVADASQRTAGAYSRRGMGDSGYSTGAQQDLMVQGAMARAQAREAARASAVGEQQTIVGNQSEIALDPYKTMYEAAAQRLIGNEHDYNQNASKGIGTILSLAAGAAAMSDERLKHDIRRLNVEAYPGIPWATWKWADGTPDFGVIAQDVEKVRPDLVCDVGGYKAVYYGHLLA